MPYKDPEIRRARNREYQRDYRARNPEKVKQRSRERYAENPERVNASTRRWRENNPEKHESGNRARSAKHYADNREEEKAARREYRLLNGERLRARERELYPLGRREKMRAWRLKFKHSMTPEDYDAMLDAQEWLCYLCGAELDQQKIAIDHDHSCCPAEQSCEICRRGLACGNCNSACGLAGDNPELLRRMADALEVAQAEVDQRKAAQAGDELTA